MEIQYQNIVFTLEEILYYGGLIILLIALIEILIFKVYYREKIKRIENKQKEYGEAKSEIPITDREIILKIDELAKLHKRTREQEIEWGLEWYIKRCEDRISGKEQSQN